MSSKVFQLTETAPQFVLNFSVLVRRYGFGEWGTECVNQIVWLAIKTFFSLTSIAFTNTSIFSSMPVETESAPTKKEEDDEDEGLEPKQKTHRFSPFAPSGYRYGKILPNMAIVTASRMIVLSLLFSLTFGQASNWVIWTIFSVTTVLYCISYKTLTLSLRRKYKKKDKTVLKDKRLQGFFTSLTGPCVIGRIDSPFYMASSILSSTFYILALAVFLIFAFVSPGPIFTPNGFETTVENATTCTPRHHGTVEMANQFKVFCYIGFGAIVLSIPFSYNLLRLFKKQNIVYVIRHMIDSGNLKELKTYFSK